MSDKKEYSLVFRIIHWAIAISILLLLITIFLRLTWLNKHNVAAIIQDYLQAIGLPALSEDQAFGLAKKIRQPMWDWHIYIGYFLVGLFSLRFILAPFGHMKFQNPLNHSLSTKEKFQNWTYIIFYLCIIVSLTTGLMIVLGPKELKEPMEEIHVLGIYYLIAYIVIHLAGIFTAEFTDQKGIVSNIISGSKGKDSKTQ